MRGCEQQVLVGPRKPRAPYLIGSGLAAAQARPTATIGVYLCRRSARGSGEAKPPRFR